MTKIFFPSQNSNEKILLILRRHWFIFLKFLVIYFLIGLIPVGLYFANKSLGISMFSCEVSRAIKVLIISAFYLFWWLLAFRQFMDYWLDVWIVTDQRVVNVNQKGLFFRTISELKLFRIQDVTADVRGLLPTFLHYGNVHIQTAGSQKRFIFEEIPHPYQVTRKIMRLVEWKRKHLSTADIAEMRQAPVDSKDFSKANKR